MRINLYIPRDQFAWFPRVNTALCEGDRVCIDFCRNDVFVWDQANNCPRVENPGRCALGCDACAKLCPSDAISFPTRENLRQQIQAWRKKESDAQKFAE